MDIQQAFAEARYHMLKKVIDALGPDRMAKAMTAFDDGASSWSECFFARAFDGELRLNKNPEQQLKEALNMPTLIPIRFTWTSFDSCKGTGLKRDELKALCLKIMKSTEMDDEIAAFVKSVDFDQFKTVDLSCVTEDNVKPDPVKNKKWYEEMKELVK